MKLQQIITMLILPFEQEEARMSFMVISITIALKTES